MIYNKAKFFCSAIVMMACASVASAQGSSYDDANDNVFTHIDWSNVSLSGDLPEFCKTIEMGADYSRQGYDVCIDYPEFAELSKAESKLLCESKAEIGDEIKVETFLGVSRKEGLLDVKFVPIVKREGKFLKLLSCKLTITAKTDAAKSGAFYPASDDDAAEDNGRYRAHSVLASGKWVKIRVGEEGIYQLTPAFLSSLGFSDVNRVKLYGYGGRVQNEVISYGSYISSDYDDLEEVPLYRRSDALLFFAEGTVRWGNWTLANSLDETSACTAAHSNNTYSKYSYYFLTEGDNPLTMPTLSAPASTSQTITTYPEHVIIDKDEFSWYTGGRTFYEDYNFANGNDRTLLINTPDADNDYTSAMTVAISASSTKITTAQHFFNSKSIGSIVMGALTNEFDKATNGHRDFTLNNLTEANSLRITTTAGQPARLDYVKICYRRKLKMINNFLVFSHYSTKPSAMRLEGATANTQVWRIGYPGNPIAHVDATLDGNTLQFDVENPTLRYIAVNVNATYPTPEHVGTIANQDLHADSVADMVIIIPESGKLREQAERLADFHRNHDSLRVKVVRADVLYNEFSSGTPDGGAYRRYLKMLYDRNTGNDLPKYLLLFGSSLWDNRCLTEACRRLDPRDYLLCYESEASASEVTCYVCDDFFGMLDDGEGGNIRYDKMDIGIGRLPVKTADKAKILVDKIIKYVENKTIGSWKNTVCFLADDGDRQKHMIGAESVAQNVESRHPNLKVDRIYWDTYTRVATATGFTYPQVTADINKAVSKGAILMDYTGHGAPYCISKELVLKTANFKAFSSAKVPMWVVASCEITPYDREEENIGVESMVNPNGAAIAFMSSARAVYSTQNSYINNYYVDYVFSRTNGKRNTIGDAMRLTKVNLVSSIDGEVISARDYSENKLKYALMGDPAITLSIPTQTAVLDSINGVALSSGRMPNLSAGSKARFSGHIEDEDGNRLPSFNGQVSITLYDSQDTVTCKNNTNEDVDPLTYYSYDHLLFESNDSVSDGQFSVVMPIPLDIKYSNGEGMVKLYAATTDHTLEANGTDKRFTIGGTSPNYTASTQGPKIYVYLNNPEFQNGQTVNDTPYFYANLSDSDGINITGNGVGHDLELIIDGKESTSYVLNPYYENDFGSYTSGKVSFMIPTLEDGEHRLMFRAWDVKNNSSSAVLDFVVDASIRPQLNTVYLSDNPASTSTTFIIYYDRPNSETTFTIDVYNLYGQHVWSHTEKAITSGGYHTIPWDLTSNNGVALQGGLYIYKVAISCNDSKQSTKKQKLIIHRQ